MNRTCTTLPRPKWIHFCLLITLLGIMWGYRGSTAVYALTFTVNSTADAADATPGDGICATGVGTECTLRAAIQEANAWAGADTITFNIAGGGVQTITSATFLPPITESLTIDATTQPGASCAAWPPTLQIELNGATTATAALWTVSAVPDITIRGLVINGFVNGIQLQNSSNSVIECNFIGTNADGTAVSPNMVGIRIIDSTNTQILHNVVSGNTSSGVALSGTAGNMTTGTVIQGNFIGTDVDGLTAVANNIGVDLGFNSNPYVQNNLIGTNADGVNDAAERNILSGNLLFGIYTSGPEVTLNQIQGNYIGTDITGLSPLPNQLHGIYLQRSSGNFIGGSATGAGNVISGNNGRGVQIWTDTAGQGDNNTIQSNIIGLGADGATALGNQGYGIYLETVAGTVIQDNTISANGGAYGNDGLLFGAVTTVQGNFIGTDSTGTLDRSCPARE